MTVAIGITTQIIRQAKWYKYFQELGFQVVEINRQNSKLHFNLYFLEKVKRYTQGFDLSVHSGTAGIFQTHEPFTRANLAVLSAEIDVCRILGAGQLVFHLNDGIMSGENKKRLAEVFARSRDLGVEMLYESNCALVAEYAYDILESFPDLGYVLDLGHLNNGYGRGMLGCEIDEFVENIRRRTVYVHASNNSGTRDDHGGLEEGTLDWRGVLDLLDFSLIRKIILEMRFAEAVEGSKKALLEYLIQRSIPHRPA